MRSFNFQRSAVIAMLVILIAAGGCKSVSDLISHQTPVEDSSAVKYEEIKGFSKKTNQRLKKFFVETKDCKGRKVAVFDCDGTLIGQTPNYLADESLYSYAHNNPERKPEVIKEMTTKSNVASNYVTDRIEYWAGMKVTTVENIGAESFEKHYKGKFYPEMLELLKNLTNNGFECWVITASPEVVYEKFVSEKTGIPKNRIIGVKSVIKNGILTDEIVQPIPQDEGKEYTIDTFIKVKPLLAAGNSRGDLEMIETSTKLKMIINPDDTKEKDLFDGMTLKDYAREDGWLIVNCNDIPEPDFPGITTKVFKIRQNTPHPKPAENN
ncbi:MAG: haloacid dehalogenase-like hydrolase [Victivallales bacterium]|nr:haloacid dehalogenase-like hydrolase [Victivallales bacterium]